MGLLRGFVASIPEGSVPFELANFAPAIPVLLNSLESCGLPSKCEKWPDKNKSQNYS
jgi:hypothetical protein